MGLAVPSRNRLAVRQGLNDHLARLRQRRQTVDNLIQMLELYQHEHQAAAIGGPKTPGYRLPVDRALSA